MISTGLAPAEATPEQVFAGMVDQMVPLKRPQTPTDMAEVVAFRLSDKAANITGQTIAVDGGTVMT
ncbi:SDR family oxidoreductase [Variovorax sp. LjRoot178]|uniref:SDR family oxidoreductase n=1 Tax=Variovorax sp. LjRoot178 TaxID=3342277 RepID=UPI003ECD8F45